jgi:hypothetical protein
MHYNEDGTIQEVPYWANYQQMMEQVQTRLEQLKK